MDELEARLDASDKRMEEKMEESNKRLESKIDELTQLMDESTQRMEAMFQQLILRRASHADSTPPQYTDLPVRAALVSL